MKWENVSNKTILDKEIPFTKQTSITFNIYSFILLSLHTHGDIQADACTHFKLIDNFYLIVTKFLSKQLVVDKYWGILLYLSNL